MPQLFKPRANTIIRVGLVGAPLLGVGLVVLAMAWVRSPWYTRVGLPLEQPVPFSHQHHVGGLGIDCRYCHNSVEVSPMAGLPATDICMSCHSQLWTQAGMLEPVRDSLHSGRPLRWQRVHDLPDFVYFDHSIHISQGIGCVSCHGRVDRMPLTWKAESLQMGWCLDCHRHPERQIRPRDKVFDLAWQPPVTGPARAAYGQELLKANGIRPDRLTDCSICHR